MLVQQQPRAFRPQELAFSDAGLTRLDEAVADYTAALITESSSRSRRHRADVVSAYDVEQATAVLLRPLRRSLRRYSGSLGGIFLGAALSNALALVATPNLTRVDVALTAATGVTGVIGVMFYAVRGS
jgi:uncharacterized protein (DUF2342 family)